VCGTITHYENAALYRAVHCRRREAASSVRLATYCERVRARSSISDGRSLARSRRSNGLKLWPNQSALFRHPTNANSISTIRKAYTERLKQCHPDRVSGLAPALVQIAEDMAKRQNRAFEEAKHRPAWWTHNNPPNHERWRRLQFGSPSIGRLRRI
jgi:hypothetical protein